MSAFFCFEFLQLTSCHTVKSSEAIMAKMGTLRDMLMCEDCERSVAARLQTLQIQLAELDRQRSV